MRTFIVDRIFDLATVTRGLRLRWVARRLVDLALWIGP